MENKTKEPFRVMVDNGKIADVSWETLQYAQAHADSQIDHLRKDLEKSRAWQYFRHQPDLDKVVALKKRQIRECDEWGQSEIVFFGTIIEIIHYD